MLIDASCAIAGYYVAERALPGLSGQWPPKPLIISGCLRLSAIKQTNVHLSQ